MVVHAFRSQRIVPIAFDLVTQRADHLGMAKVAPFPDIDVAAGQLQRRVRPHAVDHFDRAFEVEQRCDLDQAANGDDSQDSHNQDDRVRFEDLVSTIEGHGEPYSAGWSSPVASVVSLVSGALTVIQRLKAMISAPIRNSAPPAARMT